MPLLPPTICTGLLLPQLQCGHWAQSLQGGRGGREEKGPPPPWATCLFPVRHDSLCSPSAPPKAPLFCQTPPPAALSPSLPKRPSLLSGWSTSPEFKVALEFQRRLLLA
eukprot:1156903-Pelagomonas_calceolata.AAC.9